MIRKFKSKFNPFQSFKINEKTKKRINFTIKMILEIMKTNLLLLLLIICFNFCVKGQTIYYYGVNNKPLAEEGTAITMIQIRQITDDRTETETSVKWKNEWKSLFAEKIKIKNDNEYFIRKYANGRQTDRYVRFYIREPDDTYKFVEMDNDAVMRRGATTTRLPLCFEGEVIEYYPDESVKSKSIYHNNQLFSNENWLQNGEKYIDNIFYSADIPPLYDLDKADLHSHISSEFSKHKLIDISGTILVGFVIMETGELTGARIVQGITSDLDEVAVNAIESFPGKWQPAQLNNSNVRYYCTMPINFKRAEEFISFDYMDFTDGMIFY